MFIAHKLKGVGSEPHRSRPTDGHAACVIVNEEAIFLFFLLSTIYTGHTNHIGHKYKCWLY